jgi:hypothetical protein
MVVFTMGFLFDSLSLSSVVVTVPQIIISGTLILLFVQLLIELGITGMPIVSGRDQTGFVVGQDDLEPHISEAFPRLVASVLWVGLLTVLVWLLGLVMGPSLFSLIYLRGSGRESWFLSMAYSLILSAVLVTVFSGILNVTLYGGLLADVLGR